MFDFIIDAIAAVGELIVDALPDIIGAVSVIAVTMITADIVIDELRKDQELKQRGAVEALVREVIKEGNCVVVTLDALNQQAVKVGEKKMKTTGKCNLYQGQKIKLYA